MSSLVFDKRPQVMVSNPKANATDVPTSITAITLGFNTDLDTNFLDGNFRLQDRDGIIIPIAISYESRTVTMTILVGLNPNTTYQILVFGDSNISDTTTEGVRNIFGTAMAGIYESTFRTEAVDTIVAPTILSPAHQTSINTQPVFTWGDLVDAVSYELVVSKSNQLEPIFWPTPGTLYTSASVTPNIMFEDGNYYWRVRAIGADGRKGDWSTIHQFNLDTVEEGTVSDEDTLSPTNGLFYDPFIDSLEAEVVETFPKEGASSVKTTLKTVYIRVYGTVTLDEVSIEMTGEHATGEGEDHGQVTGTIQIVPQTDGTTIIAFTPNVLS